MNPERKYNNKQMRALRRNKRTTGERRLPGNINVAKSISSPARNFGNNTTIVEATAPIFRSAEYRHLRYYEPVSVAISVGALTSYVFSANGLFDPNVTGGTRQPMGFDQLMLSFNHYCVAKARITVTSQNACNAPVFVAIAVSPSPTPIASSIETLIEFGGLTMESLESKGVSGATRVLQQTVDMRKVQGSVNITDVTALQGDVTSNPVEQTYFIIYTWNTQASTGSVFFDVIIDFDSYFLEPRILPVSIQKTLKLLIKAEAESEERKHVQTK